MTYQTLLTLHTQQAGLLAITREVQACVQAANITTGLCHLFLQHTSASLLINENYEASVISDLQHFIEKLVPENSRQYQHNTEGDDDMPAHIKTALTHTSLTIPIRQGVLALGTWQGIFLWEHRRAPHQRKLVVTITE